MSFRTIFVKGTTLDDTWFKVISEVYKEGRRHKITTGSYAGFDRIEADFLTGVIQYPSRRPLAPIMPEGVPPVTTDEDIENYFVNYLMDGRNLSDNEHYRYATWIAGGGYKIPQFCIPSENNKRHGQWTVVPNQVEWIIKHYKEGGFGNNHCFITVGYPESNFAYDEPYTDETDRQTSPCLRGVDTKIISEDGIYKLCAHVYFRSWDLYGAWPENIGGITLLMEYIANELEVEVDTLCFSSMKGHLYDFQVKAVEARLKI